MLLNSDSLLVPTNHHKTCAQSHYNDPHTNLSLRKQRKPLVVGLVLTVSLPALGEVAFFTSPLFIYRYVPRHENL